MTERYDNETKLLNTMTMKLNYNKDYYLTTIRWQQTKTKEN